jgi:hypothetical protein
LDSTVPSDLKFLSRFFRLRDIEVEFAS